jgi:Uncharacterized protein conserved in bacteria (DUF2252)
MNDDRQGHGHREPSIVAVTHDYERWLGSTLTLLPEDLALKHKAMTEEPFAFLRATYYWWALSWPTQCPELAGTPVAVSIGDLHVENFGTWRDLEGRLVWGINDLDEAWPLPFANDLVRIATSALVARDAGKVALSPVGIASALLEGYRDSLAQGGIAYVLAEHHEALRAMATARLQRPEQFWMKLQGLPEVRSVPTGARKALVAALPTGVADVRWLRRTSGLGSLGRPRIVALATLGGGHVAREAKGTAPSAAAFAAGLKPRTAPRYADSILAAAQYTSDPYLHIEQKWTVRRLAADCSRIELAALPEIRDEKHLFHAMGAATATAHLISVKPRVLEAALASLAPDWLPQAARRMRKVLVRAWQDWRVAHGPP